MLRQRQNELEKQLGQRKPAGDIDLSQRLFQMLNQIKCHTQLNGNKLKLQRPFNPSFPESLVV
jgi:light-regulated signal transduction histidine kinase (bacteriophytochrome)